MAEQLASVPEESTTFFTTPYPPRNSYRESIRSVALSGAQVRSTRLTRSLSGQSGSSCSSYSGASSSYLSNNSACSGGLFGAYDLARIARRMARDGFTRRVLRAFQHGGDPGSALETWFFELDVDWVLQIRELEGHGSGQQLQDKSASSLHLQELVERWIRALIVIAVCITDLVVVAVDETPAVAQFGKASISAMLVFIGTVVSVSALRVENLRAVLDLYVCVSNASYMFTPAVISPEAQSIFNEIGGSLSSEVKRLSSTISGTMEEVWKLMEDDDSWAIEIPRGGGDVHANTRFMVDCIVSMREACASTQNSVPSQGIGNLCSLIVNTIDYLMDLLLRKSEVCSDPSLRYLFLLNNSYFVAQPSVSLDSVELWCGLTPECKNYMDSYLDASWGHMMSMIPVYPRPLSRWINTSPLAKFKSAFHKTYQAQKFWKVPDPRLRSLLRETITKRVISSYSDCLKKYPELEKHISGGSSISSSFDILRELFEG